MDEYVYIDYVVKFPEQIVVRTGEKTGPESREYISCFGVANYGKFNEQACDTGVFSDDSQFPYGGITSADIYTPLYFAVTWAFAETVGIFLDIDFLSAARLSGFIWLGAAMIFLYLALLRLNMAPLISFTAALALIGPPATWWTNTFVSTDAPALLAGSLSFWGLITFLQRGKGVWLPVFIGIFTTLLKFQNIIATVFVGLVILFSSMIVDMRIKKSYTQEISRKKAIFSSTAIILSSVFAQLLWFVSMKVMAIGEAPDQGVTGGFSFDTLSLESINFLSGFAFAPGTLPNTASILTVISTLFTWLIVGGIVAGTISGKRKNLTRHLSFIFIFVSTTSAVILSLLLYFVADIFISLPARYGYSLFPIAVGIVALTLTKSTFWKVFFVALAFVSFLFSLAPLQVM
jgi:hypothetical protein